MYKKIGFVLLSVFLLTPSSQVLADAKVAQPVQIATKDIDKKEVSRIKELFGIKKGFEDFEVSVDPSTSHNGYLKNLSKDKTTKSYHWQDETNGSISVQVSSDGDIIRYMKFFNDEEMIPLEVSREEVEQKILEILPKMYKNAKEFKITDFSIIPESKEYVFSLKRYIHDIPVADGNIHIIYSNKLQEFTRIDFESTLGDALLMVPTKDFDTKANIDKDKAFEILKKESPLKLSLLPFAMDKDLLKHVYYTDLKKIDAKTGESEIYWPYQNFMETEAKDMALDPQEIKTIEGIKGLKTEAQAKTLAEKIIDGAKAESIRLTSNKENYLYEIQLKERNHTAFLTLNAKNLKIESLDHWTDKDTKNKMDDAQNIKLATDFIKKYSSSKELNFEEAFTIHNNVYAEVRIPRFIDGKKVVNNFAVIAIDGSGKVSYYSKNFLDYEIEKNNLTINEMEANDIYFNSGDFGLTFIIKDGGPKLYWSSLSGNNPIIDNDKVLKDVYLKEIHSSFQYEDLNESKDKEIIEKLSHMNIGFTGKKLKDKVTLVEFISQMNGYDDINDKEMLNNYGIRDAVNKRDKNLLEKDLVSYLVYSKNLKPALELDGIYRENLFENQKRLKEYEKVYIFAYALGLVDKSIAPEKELTVEEVLLMMNKNL
ncbi:hypothetical protein LQU94_06160 [Peptoniphilus sp. KCTC 25270]|uniref:YcdB/YcdC domain-containing protein n=1 Tax=Peptoniphilus sp. KCTC 25270 TaxID=2897414 RepID=UPI001E2ABBF4|nr:YcdB/YcdC domain-containing protein [Peptoniphilus sp. KCTC 25270]MCD1147694.1 hypothetical protein [Peptoniphilus sp. KCTC 25270]